MTKPLVELSDQELRKKTHAGYGDGYSDVKPAIEELWRRYNNKKAAFNEIGERLADARKECENLQKRLDIVESLSDHYYSEITRLRYRSS